MRLPRAALGWLAFAACAAGASPARAGSASDRRAEADAEFAEGKALMDAGQTSAACPKFAHSQELDPRLGRLLNLAFCHEQEGKTASAWREYMSATEMAEQRGQSEREDFARAHASAVAKKLALVGFDIPRNAASVTVDGEELPHEQWSTPVPLDPGRHAVVVSATGKTSRTATINVAAQPGMQLVTFDLLEDEAAKPAAVVAPETVRPVRAPNRTAAYVATGATALALAIGAGFGVDAVAKKSAADPHCPGKVCDGTGSQLVSEARSSAFASTVALGCAGVGAIAAAWLFLRPPAKSEAAAWVAPAVEPHRAGIDLGGRW